MKKFEKAISFAEAFKVSESTDQAEFFCEVSFMQPRYPGHPLLGTCDLCEQHLEGLPHLCFGEVKHDDFEFEDFNEDDCDEGDEDE